MHTVINHMQNCDKMIACHYGAPKQMMNPIAHFNGVVITTGEIEIKLTSAKGWVTSFNKDPALVSLVFKLLSANNLVQILAEEIKFHKMYKFEQLLKMDYPPKIELSIEDVPQLPSLEPLNVCVEGLSKEYVFKLKPGTYTYNSSYV